MSLASLSDTDEVPGGKHVISGVRFALCVGTWVPRVDLAASPFACHVLVRARFCPAWTTNLTACFSISSERHTKDARPCFGFIMIVDEYQK